MKRVWDISTSEEEAAVQVFSQDLHKRKTKRANSDEPESGCSHYPTDQPEHPDGGSTISAGMQ